ncbi:protease inhibitor I42 family protein [Lysobacter terrae]
MLALTACYATYAYRRLGEQAAPRPEDDVASHIGARPPGNCRETTADAAAQKPNRVAGLEPSALDVLLTDASKPVCVYKGQALRIHLPASPAIGYEWVLEDGAPSVLRLETDPGGEPTSRLLTATTSVQSWEFRAEHSGRATLHFACQRPWDAHFMQMRTARFDVIVF